MWSGTIFMFSRRQCNFRFCCIHVEWHNLHVHSISMPYSLQMSTCGMAQSSCSLESLPYPNFVPLSVCIRYDWLPRSHCFGFGSLLWWVEPDTRLDCLLIWPVRVVCNQRKLRLRPPPVALTGCFFYFATTRCLRLWCNCFTIGNAKAEIGTASLAGGFGRENTAPSLLRIDWINGFIACGFPACILELPYPIVFLFRVPVYRRWGLCVCPWIALPPNIVFSLHPT